MNQLAFQPLSNPRVSWYQPAVLPATIASELITTYQGQGLTWEHVLLDLHSGRILGQPGVWLYDAAALLLLFLALSGFIMWYQRYLKRNRR